MATAATESKPIIAEHDVQNGSKIDQPESPNIEITEPFVVLDKKEIEESVTKTSPVKKGNCGSSPMKMAVAPLQPHYTAPFPAYNATQPATQDLDEKTSCLQISDEKHATPMKSPVHRTNDSKSMMSENNNGIHPKNLFQRDVPALKRQDSYTQTHGDDPEDGCYVDLDRNKFSTSVDLSGAVTSRRTPDAIEIPFKFPDRPSPRQAWVDRPQLRNEGGYNSDSDVQRARSRTKKTSLGDRDVSGSYEAPSPLATFEKRHRRVRSGDAPMMGIDANNEMYSRQFDSRQLVSMGDAPQNPAPMGLHHYQSESNMYQFHSRPQSHPQYIQSISVDGRHNGDLGEHMMQHSDRMLALQTAQKDIEAEEYRLKDEVRSLGHDLEVVLSIETRTEKDCKNLEDEIRVLRKNIQEIHNECDKYGFHTPGDPPPAANRRISDLYSPTSGGTGFQLSPAMSPAYPSPVNNPLRPAPVVTPPVITTQPGIGKRQTSTSKYENIPDFSVLPQRTPPHADQVSASPPPLPPRQPANQQLIAQNAANEKWECPTCTFHNLIVLNCEMCNTPRPYVGRR